MISAIANPFLYGYFNETFKDGLEKIFSLCCRHVIRHKNDTYEQNNTVQSEVKTRKNQNGNMKSSQY